MQAALSLALGLLTVLGAEQEKISWEAWFTTQWPAAPEEVVSGYLAAVKRSVHYEVGQALTQDSVDEEIATWRETQGYVVATRYTPFLRLLDGVRLPGEGDAAYRLNHRVTDQMPEITEEGRLRVDKVPPGVRFLELQVETEGGKTSYRVQPHQLSAIEFRSFHTTAVQSPLYERVDRHSAHNEPLVEVVDRLCRMAGVGFSYSATRAEGIQVTQELQHRTIKECLEMAARAADFTVVYDGITSSEEIPLHEVRNRLLEFREKMDPKDDPLITPMNVLKDLVCAQALEMGEQGLAVTLEPRKSSP